MYFIIFFCRTDVDAASGTKSGTLKFVRTLTNISKDAGGVAHMRCEVVGDPPPTKIRWFKNEAPLEEDRPKITIRKIHAQVCAKLSLLQIRNCFSENVMRKKIFFSNISSSISVFKLKFYIFIHFRYFLIPGYSFFILYLSYYYSINWINMFNISDARTCGEESGGKSIKNHKFGRF